jgi:hypothetical protein
MRLHGIVRGASLIEAAGSDRLELVLELQGVGPAQPRRVVVPHEVLIRDDWIDPDQVVGRGIDAEVTLDDDGRWMVVELILGPGRVLRPPPEP